VVAKKGRKKTTTRKKEEPTKAPLPQELYHRLREGILILTVAVALYILLSLVTYHTTDPGWSRAGAHNVANGGGRVGAYLADILFSFVGYWAYCLPIMIAYAAWSNIKDKAIVSEEANWHLFTSKWVGFCLTVSAGSALLNLWDTHGATYFSAPPGGILGSGFSRLLTSYFNDFGASVILLALFFIGVTFFTGLIWRQFLHRSSVKLLAWLKKIKQGLGCHWQAMRMPREKEPEPIMEKPKPIKIEKPLIAEAKSESLPPPRIETAKTATVPTPKPPKITGAKGKGLVDGLPSLELLEQTEATELLPWSRQALEEKSHEVERHLADFGIIVRVEGVHPGPVVTRYELSLAPGVKVSKITGLSKDLARALSVVSVRVVEVIPGKSFIGLELPNDVRETVRLREILESKQYQQSKSPLSLALGKDIAGLPIIVDLAKMPHLLVAGTTGAGKSVGLNAMILSLLYKAKPEDVRIIMVDPKMLELSVYEGIPHLLTPVVTDMREAANALKWCVTEMDKRYALMASLGVRNLAGYNQKVKEAIKEGTPLVNMIQPEFPDGSRDPLAPLPAVVVIVDEFADMMLVVGKKVEQLIARIAQKARAAGIHLILATQRPSVDVITGLIKANIPTRLSFQVSSRIDSRTVLDQQGAEQLLGHGDMLYLPPGTGVPNRVHGAYVADEEVHNVVSELRRAYGPPQYLVEVLESDEDNEGSSTTTQSTGEADPLYDEVVALVIDSGRVSISSIQRRFKIGFNRAARLVEDMEAAGVVSRPGSNGGREVLVQSSVE
jgi:DNA segregation ATPase FtsK/SpoIIIE, S-DNA-T family